MWILDRSRDPEYIVESDFPIFTDTTGGRTRARGEVSTERSYANVSSTRMPTGGPYKMEKLRTREERFRFCTFLCDNYVRHHLQYRPGDVTEFLRTIDVNALARVNDNRPKITG